MNYKDESDLARIKSNIFQDILASEKRREDERKMGIIHKPECFSQPPPWSKP